MKSLFDIDRWQEIMQTLLQNKTRSLLTAFGIFWGIFMLLLLMGGSEGLKRLMAKNFDGFAQNSYFIMAGSTSKPYKGFRSGREWSMEQSDLQLLRNRSNDLEVITPLLGQWGKTFTYRDQSSSGTLKGMHPEYAQIENPHITQGRFINDADIQQFRKVCVIGKRVNEELFPGIENPCGQFICVDNVYYQVVGVSKMSSTMGVMGPAEQSVIIPATTMQRIYNMGNKIQAICMTIIPGKKVDEVMPLVEKTIREAHSIAPDDSKATLSFNMEAMFQMVNNLFEGIQTLTWLIGLGTLLSGIIGVSNIMMVTVRERTIEIGIRRAIGARPSSILSQILAESMVLTLMAGLSGITISTLLLNAVEAIATATGNAVSFQVSFEMAVGSALALAALGGIAGIAPAMRALAIKPIDAIRDE